MGWRPTHKTSIYDAHKSLIAMSTVPKQIKLQQEQEALALTYVDGSEYSLSFELLRVLSPSAEVRGHGPDDATLQTGKRRVKITAIEPTGNYAIKIVFDDGHDSGLYSWDYLWHLCQNRDDLWQQYLDDLAAVGGSREPLFINVTEL